MRKKLLFGNWKMNKTIDEAKEFAVLSVNMTKEAIKKGIDVGISPSFLSLDAVRKNNPFLIVASQNVNDKDSGAYTGEVSVPMLRNIQIEWSLIGHSERRQYNGETNATCQKKNQALIAGGLSTIYCVGETLDQFEKGLTKQIVSEQLKIGLAGIDEKSAGQLVVAYEPVWSIGTGRNASKEIAEDICQFIRNVLNEQFGQASENIRILYGGSVKPDNIKEYLSMPNIDGALVGGASLKIESFAELLKNIQD